MPFITNYKKRAVRQSEVYKVLVADMIEIGLIDHPSIKTWRDFVDILEGNKKVESTNEVKVKAKAKDE